MAGPDGRFVRQYESHYNRDLALPRYNNELPYKDGKAIIPPNTIIALVDSTCASCHSFLAATQYPDRLPAPDGRDILYIDQNSPRGKAYMQDVGLEVNLYHLLGDRRVTLNGAPLPNNTRWPAMPKFPVLLETDERGTLTRAVSVGIEEGINFIRSKGGKILETAENKETSTRLAFAEADQNSIRLSHVSQETRAQGTQQRNSSGRTFT